MTDTDQELMIGAARFALPGDHHLPRIMRQHPQYDYLYWNLIRAILDDNAISDGGLIDIGANIGDTIGHFRRFSKGPAWAIEPTQLYFDYLERNMAQFENVRVSQAIVAPYGIRDQVRLTVNHGTGSSSLAPDDGELFKGACITPKEIAEAVTAKSVLKSDTDGFDGRIIGAVTEHMAQTRVLAAVVAFEGPTRVQTAKGETKTHRHALHRLQTLGYRIHMLTNTGFPIGTVGCSHSALDLMLDTHRNSLLSDQMMCPYIDFICVAPGLGANALFHPPRVEKSLWSDVPLPEDT